MLSLSASPTSIVRVLLGGTGLGLYVRSLWRARSIANISAFRHQLVFAAGDVAALAIDGVHTSVMSCQHARPMGCFAEYNVVRDLVGKPMLPLRVDRYVTCLDLGAWGAVYTERCGRHVRLRAWRPRTSNRPSTVSGLIRCAHPTGARSSIGQPVWFKRRPVGIIDGSVLAGAVDYHVGTDTDRE